MSGWKRTVIADTDPPVYPKGHPWHGLTLRPAYVRWEHADGRVRWTWRPHVEAT